MTPDPELLRRYARDGDEAAFAEILRRHINLVYSVALRVARGNAPLAEEVTQSVFTDLARKAAALSRHPALPGWLHTSARFAALKAIRGEQRRQLHEQEASIMHDSNTAEFDWEQLRPVLDEAVGRLRETDRHAVVLRFFQGLSHREIGEALGLNENAARKRVDHALEKLRLQLTRAGITVSSPLLASALRANSVHAAPAGLAGKITAPTFTSAVGAGLFTTALLTILFMNTKTKIALGFAALALIVFCAIYFSFPVDKPKFASSLPTKAPPTAPARTTLISNPRPATPDLPPATIEPVLAATTIPNEAVKIDPPVDGRRTDLNSTLTDIIGRFRTGDFEDTILAYLPPDLSEQQQEEIRAALAAFKATPGSSEEISIVWPKVLGHLVDDLSPDVLARVNTMPRTRLSFQLYRAPDLPQVDRDHPGHIYLLKANGIWYIEEFNQGLFSVDVRPPAVKAENPHPN